MIPIPFAVYKINKTTTMHLSMGGVGACVRKCGNKISYLA